MDHDHVTASSPPRHGSLTRHLARCAVVVVLLAAGLAPLDTRGGLAAGPPAELVSTLDGTAPLPRGDYWPSVSGDGQIVVFTDYPEVGGDPPPPFDPQVHVRDRSAGTTIPVPVRPLVNATTSGVVSRDGCHVAYWGRAQTIELSFWEVYTWDRCFPGSAPQIVSLTSPSLGCCADFSRLAISGDGRYIAYASAVDGPGTTRVWVADALSGTEEEMLGAYVAPQQVQDMNIDIADDGSFIAVDGRFVGTASSASVVYGWERGATTTEIFSGRPGGAVPAGAVTEALDPTISADGRYVAYTSYDGASQRVVLEDRSTGALRPVTDLPGSPSTPLGGAFWGSAADISPDGTQVAYAAEPAESLPVVYVVRSTVGWFDNAAYEQISTAADGTAANAGDPSISTTGAVVAFVSADGAALSGNAAFPQNFDVWLQQRPASLSGPGAIDFGALTIGNASPPQDIVVTNTSNVIVPIVPVGAPGAGFSVVADGCSGALLQPGASCTVSVVFTPPSAGGSDATLVVGGAGATASTALHGTGLTPGSLVVTPATNDFGAVTAGSSTGPAVFTVTNGGGSPAGVGAVTLLGGDADQFAIGTDGCTSTTLAAGASCEIRVSANVTREGARTADLLVSGTGGQTTSAGLVVTGEAPPPPSTTSPTTTTPAPSAGVLRFTPDVVDLGPAEVGTLLGPRSLTVTNTGGQSFTVSNVAISGSGASQFAISSNGCAAKALAPNATCVVQVTATPTQALASSATVTATGSGGQTDSSSLRVTGTPRLYTPTLVMNPGVARPGQVTAAVGAGFPPGAVVQLAFDGELPFATVTADATGGLRASLLILRNTKLVGGYDIVALDQPEFTGVRAPLLIDQASFQPSGVDDAGLANGLRALYGRGG